MARIRPASWDADISSEKNATPFLSLPFWMSSKKLRAVLNARQVAKAVFPMPGRPAKISRSDLCSPPILLSRSRNPVDTPEMPSGFFLASDTS